MDTYQWCNALASIPELAVWGVGGWLCLNWSQRHPRLSTLLGLALLLQVVRRFGILYAPEVSEFLRIVLPGSQTLPFLVFYLLFSIPNAVSWGLILWALWQQTRPRVEIEG